MPWEYPQAVPYCGLPPSPDALWSRWNLDPVLLAALAALACAYLLGARRLDGSDRAIARGERGAFCAGWLIASAALVSPLCALSVALFSARVGQHMILALVAAPLVAAGRPAAALAGLLAKPGSPLLDGREHSPISTAPLLAAGMFAVLLWFWHAPAPYQATFSSTLAYWAMHVSLFGAAVWLWSGLLDRRPARMVHTLGASMISTVQMGLLGALITIAPRPAYAPHALTTAAWGLTPLQDQQLGGGIMWVPGCVVFFVASMLVLWLALRRMDWESGRPAGLGLR